MWTRTLADPGVQIQQLWAIAEDDLGRHVAKVRHGVRHGGLGRGGADGVPEVVGSEPRKHALARPSMITTGSCAASGNGYMLSMRRSTAFKISLAGSAPSKHRPAVAFTATGVQLRNASGTARIATSRIESRL